jgi:hypothetical protein
MKRRDDNLAILFEQVHIAPPVEETKVKERRNYQGELM